MAWSHLEGSTRTSPRVFAEDSQIRGRLPARVWMSLYPRITSETTFQLRQPLMPVLLPTENTDGTPAIKPEEKPHESKID